MINTFQVVTVCTWYINCPIHELIYLYVHHDGTCMFMNVNMCMDVVQTHMYIRPYQHCDTGESQLCSGSSPSEQPPSSVVASAGETDRDLAVTQFPRNCVPYNIIEF
jgi:hypothetical protein